MNDETTNAGTPPLPYQPYQRYLQEQRELQSRAQQPCDPPPCQTAYQCPQQDLNPPSKARPFIANWKTNTARTMSGIILTIVFARTIVLTPMIEFSLDNPSHLPIFVAFYCAWIAILSVGIYYAAAVYPSLFSEWPKAKSAALVSFANGFFGGFIFGLLWNSCLTKGEKGVSHIVLIILAAIAIGAIALTIIAFTFG